MSAQQCSPTPNAMSHLPSASDAVLADRNHQYDLYSGDSEPSNDPFFLSESQPARDYTLPIFTQAELAETPALREYLQTWSSRMFNLLASPLLIDSFSNVIVQPTTIPALPLLPAQVLVSNISAQNPGTANQAPVICAQSNNMASRVPENYAQTPVASNQGSSSAEEDRQKVMDAAEALLILHNSSQAPQVLKESEE